MSGLFGSFNTAVKGLSANQAGLQTTFHNINNINTKGFHRQRVEFKADIPNNVPGVGQIGTGAKIDAVVRLVDSFVNLQLRNENSTLGEHTVKNDIMGQIESILNEPSDTGVNFAMGEMFNSWQELSKNPESLNAKSIVVEKAKTFADTLNHVNAKIVSLKDDTVGNIEKSVMDFNSLVEQLNSVNDQIFNVSVKGHSPNDLLDQRDVLLEKMSGLANITDSEDKWGRAEVKVNGELVTGKQVTKTLSTVRSIKENLDGTFQVSVYKGGDSSKAMSLTLTKDEVDGMGVGSPVFFQESGAGFSVTPAKITSGQIGGSLSSMKETNSRLEELHAFAKGTAKMFNAIHNEDGTGEDFFKFESDGHGFSLKVNQKISDDVNLVQTKKVGTNNEGDGSRALAIAKLRLAKIDFNQIPDGDLPNYNKDTMSFESNPTGQTMEGSFGNVVTKVGISVQQSSNMVDNQDALMGQLSNRRESISGVSLDEEVTNLVKFQRSYEANSRVINTINEMLDTLINRTGV